MITSILGPSIINSMIAIGIFYIPIFARLTRAVALSVWKLDYIDAARACGPVRVDHNLPHVLAQYPLAPDDPGHGPVRIAILAEAGLSYLGLGPSPPTPPGAGCSTRPRPIWPRVPGWPFSRPGHRPGRAGLQPAGRRFARHPGPQAGPGPIERSLVTQMKNIDNDIILKALAALDMDELIDLTAQLVRLNTVWTRSRGPTSSPPWTWPPGGPRSRVSPTRWTRWSRAGPT